MQVYTNDNFIFHILQPRAWILCIFPVRIKINNDNWIQVARERWHLY